MNRQGSNRIPLTLAACYIGTGITISLLTGKGDSIVFLNQWHSPAADLAAYYLTDLGDALPYWIAVVILLFVRLRYALCATILGLANMAISVLLKVAWGHPRPFTWFQEAGLGDMLNPVEFLQLYDAYNSFPSGHTLAAFTLFTFLALIARRTWVKVVAVLIACLVGITRIYLNLHFIEDVTFGAFCGVLLAVAGYWAQQRFLGGRKRWDASLQQIVARRDERED